MDILALLARVDRRHHPLLPIILPLCRSVTLGDPHLELKGINWISLPILLTLGVSYSLGLTVILENKESPVGIKSAHLCAGPFCKIDQI